MGNRPPVSIFEHKKSPENEKRLGTDKRSMKEFVASYNRSDSGMALKVTSQDINTYIPPTETRKAKNHFHDRVKVDEAALSSIKDYFLTEQEYKKLRDFTKSLLIERFGGYYTLMKLKAAKPNTEWIDQMEAEQAENARDLFELYQLLDYDGLERVRLKAKQNTLPPEIDRFFAEVVDRGLNRNENLASTAMNKVGPGRSASKKRLNNWIGSELVGDDGYDIKTIENIKLDAMLREYVEEIDRFEFRKF